MLGLHYNSLIILIKEGKASKLKHDNQNYQLKYETVVPEGFNRASIRIFTYVAELKVDQVWSHAQL
jgi:hypothetical protein